MSIRDGVIDEYIFDEDAEPEAEAADDDPISVDDAVSMLSVLIDDAANFISTEWMPEWEKAEEYFDGGTDLPTIPGRSRATDTAVRDATRAVKTSIMRALTAEDTIVEYRSQRADFADLARIQTKYVQHLFWANDGYRVLVDIVHDVLLKNVGIVYADWQEDYSVENFEAKGIDAESYQQLANNPSVSITSAQPTEGATEGVFFDVEFSYVSKIGKIVMEHVPLYEFFITDSATNTKDARVIGRRRSIPVGDCIAMGLEYEDWGSLDDLDPEDYDATGESQARRGYIKDNSETTHEVDPSMRKILLTEVYARFDFDGAGVPQLYRFYLGGTSYQLIDYEKIPHVPFHAFLADPQPAAFFGKSLYDIMKETQDVNTSLLRATVDNAHLTNNRRLAVHETMVNMQDVLSPKIGAPIRVRAPGMIQEISTQPTVGAMLPLLQYLNQRGEVKSGVTSAALGLDPTAMQSTDKDAVRNTIDLAKGQVEYYARNLAETGLRSLFRALLDLSIRYYSRDIAFNNLVINQEYFLPDLPIEVKVGLGNADRMEKIALLTQMEQYQLNAFQQLGLHNPVVTLEQHYNVIADKAKLMGFDDISRYMNLVDPETTAMFMQELMERMQPPPQPDPTQGLVEVETIKAQVEAQKAELDARLKTREMEAKQAEQDRQTRTKMVEILMSDDLKRDEMLQKLYIEAAKLNNQALDREQVREQQEATKADAGGNNE